MPSYNILISACACMLVCATLKRKCSTFSNKGSVMCKVASFSHRNSNLYYCSVVKTCPGWFQIVTLCMFWEFFKDINSHDFCQPWLDLILEQENKNRKNEP